MSVCVLGKKQFLYMINPSGFVFFATDPEKSTSAFLNSLLKLKSPALAGVAQWTECWPANQRVAGSIPSQGTCLGYRPGPRWGLCKRQPHNDVSLPLFLLYLKIFFKKSKLNFKRFNFMILRILWDLNSLGQ